MDELILDYVHHRLGVEEQEALEKRADDGKEIAALIALYECLVKAGKDEEKEYPVNQFG